MQKIPKTFCPAKWDELIVNFDNNYVYGCCKSTPVIYGDDYDRIRKIQQTNLLNGIQDSSCNYCWDAENKNLYSLRNHHLEKFDKKTFPLYTTNKPPNYLEINLGNECNLQCMYCNPKFSSKWYADVFKAPYKLYNSKLHYELPAIQITREDKFKEIEKIIATHKEVRNVSIMGGEPFYNKNLFAIIDGISSDVLTINTNFTCSKETLKIFIDKTNKFKSVNFVVSLDATKDISEIVRTGLDYNLFWDNFNWLISYKPSNFNIVINSVMTSLTVSDLENFSKIIIPLLCQDKTMKWNLYHCVSPEFQSFKTLKEEYKKNIIETLNELEKNPQIGYASVIKSALLSNNFDKNLHKQLITFLDEFSSRKKISNINYAKAKL